MSDAAAVMAIVLFVFFLVGVTVGITVVIAMSARRARHSGSPRAPGKATRDLWPYLRQAGPDDDEPANLGGSGGGVPEYGRLGPMDASSGHRTPFSAEDSVP